MTDLPPSVDGLRPSPLQTAENADKSPPASSNPASGTARIVRLGVIAFSVAFTVFGVVLLTLFPTTNIALTPLRLIGSLVMLAGLPVWLFIAGIAAYRTVIYRTKNVQMRVAALVKILAVAAPPAVVSMLALATINNEPPLPVDILSPPSGTELVAPLAITFGTDTAQRVLQEKGLTPIRYSWDFQGDGQIDQVTTEPQITVEYPRSGIYHVSATVEMSDGTTTRTLGRTVRVVRQVFAVDPPNPIIDEPTAFSVSHLFEDPAQFLKAEWDFDNDGIKDVETDSMTTAYTYHRLGEQEARVTVTYTNNAKTDIVRTLMIVEAPKQPFPVEIKTLPPTLLGTAPFGVVFSVETQEPIANVNWSFGDEGSAEGLIAQHAYNKVGNFPVTATIRSQSGSVARITKLVKVTNPLSLSDLRFTGEPEVRNWKIEGQQPLTVNITPDTSQPLVTFTWDVPDASEVLSTDKTLHAIFRRVGTWKAELIGVDDQQRVLRRPVEIVVRPPESVVTINVDPPTPVAPSLVKFDASETFIYDKEVTGYEWDFGDRQVRPLGAHAEHFYDKPGTYNVKLRVKTLDGAVFEGSRVLVVRRPLRDVCFLPSRTTGEAPMGVRFDAECSTEGFVTWEWDFGDDTQSAEKNPVHVFQKAGEYTVTLSATDEDGMIDRETATITVTAP